MNEPSASGEGGPKIDVFGLIKAHGRRAGIVAVIAAAVVAVAGAGYVRWGQSRQLVASLEFRPTFSGIGESRYPNGLPFSPNDVTAGPILDRAYDDNKISDPCDRESFRGAFFVEQRSDQSVFLDLEYQARLSEPRITSVDRKILQEEHAARRRSLPLQYRLVFVMPEACEAMPSVLLSKVMVEVLNTWATESEARRGVLRQQVEVLTPATLDVTVTGPGGLLLRADLLRTALLRVIANVIEVGNLYGAELVRLGPERLTFAEVQGKLRDLVGSKLDPLVMTSGRSMVRESSVWVAETVAAAERKQHAAEQKAAAFQTALREFSRPLEAPTEKRAGSTAPVTGPGTGAGQTMLPQVDSSFVDRIIEMATESIRYRQQLTNQMVQAHLEAVAEEERAAYYRRLLQSSGGSGGIVDPEELAARFADIIAEGKALTKQFGDLYDEFSRVSLRAAGAMYVTEKPVAVEVSQRFSNRSVLNIAGVTFLAVLLAALGFLAVRDRLAREAR